MCVKALDGFCLWNGNSENNEKTRQNAENKQAFDFEWEK